MVFGFGKNKQSTDDDQPTEKPGLLSRLKQGLAKTRAGFTRSLATLIGTHQAIDDDLLDELETQLLMADVGVDGTKTLMQAVTQAHKARRLLEPAQITGVLREHMIAMLQRCEQSLDIVASHKPFVILMVGINGAGKTTTIGKLAKRLQAEGKSVMLAAGDTFRAAAVEQLQEWGRRNDINVVAQQSGADAASVIYDALESAKARQVDILIADTAGRLHTQSNLMEELKKVKRVIQKLDGTAPHEVMLVLDAGTGQNAINQARQFNEAVGLTGITLTKLDGTAKGGVLFAIASAMNIPIRFIGVGEGIDDLRPFSAEEFVDALLGSDQ